MVPSLMARKRGTASSPLETGKASTLCPMISVCLRRGSVASWKRREKPFGCPLASLSAMLGRPVAVECLLVTSLLEKRGKGAATACRQDSYHWRSEPVPELRAR